MQRRPMVPTKRGPQLPMVVHRMRHPMALTRPPATVALTAAPRLAQLHSLARRRCLAPSMTAASRCRLPASERQEVFLSLPAIFPPGG